MAYLLPVSDGLFNENESGIGFEDESGHLKASYMRLRFFCDCGYYPAGGICLSGGPFYLAAQGAGGVRLTSGPDAGNFAEEQGIVLRTGLCGRDACCLSREFHRIFFFHTNFSGHREQCCSVFSLWCFSQKFFSCVL